MVAGIKWNHRPGSNGISGRNEMELMAGIKWNGWPEWNGIHGRDHLEYAVLSVFVVNMILLIQISLIS